MSNSTPPSRLLLLGWAGADWRLIQPLIDAGAMPQLESLISGGVMGNLLSLVPANPASLWTSITTGRHADAHGILDRVMPDPEIFGQRPAMSSDLRATPLWQRVSDAGRRTAAVGWPLSHPATAFDGLVVSDAFAEARGRDFDSWPLRTGALSAPALGELFTDLRLHPTEITAEQLLPFIPALTEIDQETDERLPLLVATLARASSIHGAATWICEHRDWDLLAVHFDLIERLSSAFMQYRAPRMAHVTERDFRLYREVVDGAYRFMDLLLGWYLQRVGPNTHVVLVSDHGFLTDALRSPPAPARTADRDRRGHREFGVLAIGGPGIVSDELIFGATLLDVAPTSLALLGLPITDDLEGRVLSEAFVEPPSLHTAEAAPPVDFSVRCMQPLDQEWMQGRITELVALDYLPQPAGDPEQAAEQAMLRQLGNRAQVLMAQHRYPAALAVLGELLALDPDQVAARLQVARCRFALDDTDGCREMLDDLAASGLRGAGVDYLYGQLCVKEGDTQAALDYLQRAEQAGVGGRHLLERIGHTHLQARHWVEAEQAFRKALDIDPEYASAHHGLGVALARQDNHAQAVEHFSRSLGILQQQPVAHLRLGLSLAKLGQYQQALDALNKALAMQPDFPRARKALTGVQLRLSGQRMDAVAPTTAGEER